MGQDVIRNKLIAGTIQGIARDGLDKSSTKQIGIATSINEAYIYRCFEDKEDMFSKAFDELDDELMATVMRHAEVMYMPNMDWELRCSFYFSAVWRFLLGNRDKCLSYVQYYYSPYFSKYSAQTHNERYVPFINKIQGAFKDEADVWMILNHILNVMLDFAVKVHNDQMPNNEDYAEHVFRVVYASIEQYFKSGE